MATRWRGGGYELGERLPAHSSLTRIRERYGVEVFRRFCDTIVEQCAEAGLVWGRELYIDVTKMLANTSVEAVPPRSAVAARAQLDDLFAQDAEAQGPRQPPRRPHLADPVRIGPTDEAAPDLATANATRHDGVAQSGQQDRRRVFRNYVRTTDPDATHLLLRDGVRLGYQGHDLVDGGKARIILGALATPGEVPEERPALDLLWRARFRWRLHPRQATGDKSYGTLAIVRALEEQGGHA